MTSQIADEVVFQGTSYSITAVDGTGLFDPAAHGVTPGDLGTACWRGFFCRYVIERDRLILDDLHLGRPDDQAAGELFDVKAKVLGGRALFRGALRYSGLAAQMPFTGRLLVGADDVHVGYLNMGFWPAWLFANVYELAFEGGQLSAAHDRSAALAEVRDRLGADGLRPAAGEPSIEWIRRTRSLTFDYSWPTRCVSD